MERELHEPLQCWNKVQFVRRAGTAYSWGVSVTWRRGRVFLWKMSPKSHAEPSSDRGNSLLLFHFHSSFYLLLSHSEKHVQDFSKLPPASFFFNPISNLSPFTLYPISLFSSQKIRVTHPRALHPLQKLPHYHPIRKIATQKKLFPMKPMTINHGVKPVSHTRHCSQHLHTHTYAFCITLVELKVHLEHIVQTDQVSLTHTSVWKSTEKALMIYISTGMPRHLIWPDGRNGLSQKNNKKI